MSCLKHLELSYGLFTDLGIGAILDTCKVLEHLDIRGCWNVAMQDSLAERSCKLKFFLGPVVDDTDFSDQEDYNLYDDDYLSYLDHDYHQWLNEEDLDESNNRSDEDDLDETLRSGMKTLMVYSWE